MINDIPHVFKLLTKFISKTKETETVRLVYRETFTPRNPRARTQFIMQLN